MLLVLPTPNSSTSDQLPAIIDKTKLPILVKKQTRRQRIYSQCKKVRQAAPTIQHRFGCGGVSLHAPVAQVSQNRYYLAHWPFKNAQHAENIDFLPWKKYKNWNRFNEKSGVR